MIKAEIVAHSLSPQGEELISILCTFPRIILAEVNTHRMLSKNTSSSRAIPFKKMVEAVKTNPFIPIAWQKDHKGMQGIEYFTDTHNDIPHLERMWLSARDNTINTAQIINKSFENKDGSIEGVTKQICNRLLEPFMWTTMLITGSKEGWNNFFNLRCPSYEWEYEEGVIKAKSKEEFLEMFIKRYPTNGERELHDMELVDEHLNPNNSIDWFNLNKGQAEIHIMDLAEKIYDAVNESTPRQLRKNEWHIPFMSKFDTHKIEYQFGSHLFWESLVKISVAMAARTSYTVVGDEKDIDYRKMIELHDRLLSQTPPHSSPLEHCAKAMSHEEYYSYIKGRLNYLEPDDNWNIEEPLYSEKGWCNNFKGFIQYRYIIDNKL